MNAGQYSGKLRVRSCGILEEEGRILLVQLHSPVTDSLIWMPPGGGVKQGESLKDTLTREFMEETGLQIEAGTLLHVNELIREPYHAIEFYFEVKRSGGKLTPGTDPEHSETEQLIKDLRFIEKEDFSDLEVYPLFLKNYLSNNPFPLYSGIK